MQMSDSRTIKAPQDVVFAAILNPEILKQCVPGCTEMSGSAEEGFEATVVQKVGPVKATFKGAVQLSDVDAPNSVTLSGEGKGGAAGFAKGGANVKLEAVEEGTLLTYEVEAKVGGKLAQLGSRIIDGFAKKMADQFFANFQEAVEGPSEEGETAEEAPKKGWFKKITG
ncbi:CoxG family protein [Tropicibacter naphthalenivorans]|uniref:Carbon monoxide dehydrogenase subunit G (CoxG) n=1 Tax=Tropicibacter naphthalenivorans TaxID=441103 RepID=A0A0N7LZD3_9RHOB|nr:carbon monoxide dehydrogenase subunit G [Tropicibacter naphthalenivorans]CUH77345.1 hypothetical protein TRN7648_01423 [Tropicibacter naphthalenivorans]SMC58818.1 hypothetical protein SAMN04488093_102194 [Tropicibacter naphthalenivorans]